MEPVKWHGYNDANETGAALIPDVTISDCGPDLTKRKALIPACWVSLSVF